MNVKLGGRNNALDPRSASLLSDPANPTIVLGKHSHCISRHYRFCTYQEIGADVIHPAPGVDTRPSFTALVGNVDMDSAKYVATMQVQQTRTEMIADLQAMTEVGCPTIFRDAGCTTDRNSIY